MPLPHVPASVLGGGACTALVSPACFCWAASRNAAAASSSLLQQQRVSGQQRHDDSAARSLPGRTPLVPGENSIEGIHLLAPPLPALLRPQWCRCCTQVGAPAGRAASSQPCDPWAARATVAGACPAAAGGWGGDGSSNLCTAAGGCRGCRGWLCSMSCRAALTRWDRRRGGPA